MSESTLFYDGLCVLCNRSISFIINRDKHKRFKIAHQSSSQAAKYESIVLVTNGKTYTHSTAVIKSLILLGGIYKATAILLIIPKTLRDPIYKIIAKNRYRWFGKYQSCPTMPEAWKERMINPNKKP
jgi:predicted DCC family thiol-disulfide oxidoreductase YuxK